MNVSQGTGKGHVNSDVEGKRGGQHKQSYITCEILSHLFLFFEAFVFS
jgi:hypothetical protein